VDDCNGQNHTSGRKLTMATKKKLTERQDFIRRVVAAAATINGKTIVGEKDPTKLAEQLWRMGPRSKRLAERLCSEEMSEAESERVNRIDDEMDAKVVAIGKELGLKAYRQGDPRGWTIRVVVGRDLADCMDGETTGCG
jgi:hypothetical protein